MQKYAYHILHIGLGITILWMGILIWQSPELFGSFLKPSFADKIPDLASTMRLVAFFDIVLGILLIIGRWVWLLAGIAALHFLGIIIGIGGFSDIVARDFGLFIAAISLALLSWSNKTAQSDKPQVEDKAQETEPIT